MNINIQEYSVKIEKYKVLIDDISNALFSWKLKKKNMQDALEVSAAMEYCLLDFWTLIRYIYINLFMDWECWEEEKLPSICEMISHIRYWQEQWEEKYKDRN